MSCTKPDIWMPFYIGDYLQDTMHLTTEQHGAYLLLIMACWKRGGLLPDDDAQLAAITRLPIKVWRQHKEVLAQFFQHTGAWQQKRVSQELAKAETNFRSRSASGKVAAKKRWSDEKPSNSAVVPEKVYASRIPDVCVSDAPSPSPSPSERKKEIVVVERTILRCAQEAVMDELGVRNDPNWLGDAGIVESWLNSGADLERDILPTLRRLMAGRGPRGCPRSLKYFNQAIADTMANRIQPLPAGTAQPQEHRRYGYTSGTDHARAAAKLLAERSAHPGATRAPHLALLVAK